MSWIVWAILIVLLCVGYRLRKIRLGIGVMIVVAIAMVFTLGVQMFEPNSGSDTATTTKKPSFPSASPTAPPSATETPAPTGLNEDKLAKKFASKFKKLGFKPGEVSVGKVDWAKNPIDHTSGAFGDGVKSQGGLTEFLNSDIPEGKAARRHQLTATPESEHERVLHGDNYIPIQYNVDIQYGGNTTWTNGKLMRGGKVVAEAGDVFWVFVGSDYKIYWDAAVRADCENPGLTSPPRPHTPPRRTNNPPPPGDKGGPPPATPPGDTKKCPPNQPYGEWPVCKDAPSAGPAHNAQLPTQQKPNKLPARPDHEQPTKPAEPEVVYEEPEVVKPTPKPRPTPPPAPATGAPAPTEAPSTCAPAPGRPCP